MSEKSEDFSLRWYEENIKKYQALTGAAKTILEALVSLGEVEFLSVEGRTKDLKSFLEKIERKGYEDPSIDMTDISGVRVIAYLEKEVDKICEIISSAFNVDEENSGDKLKDLDKDKLGYRSIHYVCELGDDRTKLKEYEDLGGLKFEIQVRTVLQHAWAELAHDRQYKFEGVLPKNLERELYLYAGMLEIADKGFNEISEKIDKYETKVENSSPDEYDVIEINTLSLESFFAKWFESKGIEYKDASSRGMNEVVKEISSFGISSMQGLLDIIPDSLVDQLKVRQEAEVAEDSTMSYIRPLSIPSIIRWSMLIQDPAKTLKVRAKPWRVTKSSINLIEKAVGEDKAKFENIMKVLRKNNAISEGVRIKS